MKALTLGAILVAAGFAAPPGQLTVIRSYPTAEATARSEVTVTFDRPVAGGLDGAVDPKTFFRIAPAVEGRLEWRDPITVRFLPTAPLTPGANYIVTVLKNFEAMDGTRSAHIERAGNVQLATSSNTSAHLIHARWPDGRQDSVRVIVQ